MKKKLDEATVANELRGQSRFFQKQSESESSSSASTVRANERTDGRSPMDTDEHTLVRSGERTVGRTEPKKSNKRKTIRYSFQFYEDQIEAIQRLHAQTLLEGERKDLSAFAREALDAYLDQLEERANG